MSLTSETVSKVRTVSDWACIRWRRPVVAAGAGASAAGISLLPSALKPKMALCTSLKVGLGAVPKMGKNCASSNKVSHFLTQRAA